MKIRKQLILKSILLILISISCSKDPFFESLEGNFEDKGILKNYSNFEVDVEDLPVTTEKLVLNFSGNYNYGAVPYIDFRINDDNTIDIFWKTINDKRFIDRISLEAKSKVEKIIIPNEAIGGNGQRFLGFESLGGDEFIIGYTTSNSAQTENKIAEAHYMKFKKDGTKIFDTRLPRFGYEVDPNNDTKDTGRPVNIDDIKKLPKYNPGGAGSVTVKYNKNDNSVGIYLAHSGGGHQAGWIGFLDLADGKIKYNNKDKMVGDIWYCSHNFDQRLMVNSKGNYYTLAHGDAYPRSLVFDQWNSNTGNLKKGLNYFPNIPGKTGDNSTLTTTGNFLELPNGNIAIVYSTQHTRLKRDLKIVILGGLEGTPFIVKETWLTRNIDYSVGWGASLEIYGNDKIIVGWNDFKADKYGGDRIINNSNFCLVDFNGNRISKDEKIEKKALFYPNQAMTITKDKSKIIFVSAGDGNKLKINVIEIK